MNKIKLKSWVIILIFYYFLPYKSFSQQLNLPLNRDIYQEYNDYLDRVGVDFHTSMKPYNMNDINNAINTDTLDIVYVPQKRVAGDSWLKRKVLYEHFLSVDSAHYQLHLDPVFDVERGIDDANSKSTYVNSKGVIFEGNIEKNFSFHADYYETQSVLPTYLTNYVNDTNNQIVPGQGRVKFMNNGGYDYAIASGYAAYKASKYFTFQLGTDKNFIGEGYRSLFLSDNAFNYPYFKITTTIWHLQYTNLYCAMEDIGHIDYPSSQPTEGSNQFFTRKYATIHYLSWNVSKRINIGAFETIIFADTVNGNTFRVDYLNPIIFYRPVEFSIGSPNNSLVGGAFNYKFSDHTKFYSQLIIDDFEINEVRHYSHGWFGNKQGIQAGIKSNDLFGVHKLRFQTEWNWVRPYTYSHETALQSYTQYNQALADPLGANFYESISFLSYRTGRFFFEFKFNYAAYGLDSGGVDFGQNPFESYITPAQTRPYGNYTTQGLFTTLIYKEFRVSYLINSAYNVNLELGLTFRSEVNNTTNNTTIFTFGIKTSLTNHYYDF
jgi:hypothetical protein